MIEIGTPEHNIRPKTKADIERPRARYWQVLTSMALMAMELAWVVPWYRLMTWTSAPTTRLQVFTALGFILAFAYFSMGLIDHFRLKRKYLIATLGVGLVVSVAVGFKLLLFLREAVTLRFIFERIALGGFDSIYLIPPEYAAILTILIIWQRGVSLARERLGSLSVIRGFKRGLILLAANGLISYPLIGVVPTVDLYGFLFVGLVAMGAARLSTLSRLRGGKNNPFDRRWVLGVLGFAAAVLIVGAIFTLLARDPLTTGVSYFVSIAFNLVSRVLVVILWPVVFAGIHGLSRVVDWINLQSMDGLESPQTIQTQNELTQWLQQMQQTDPPIWIEKIVPVLKSVLLWGLVCLILVFLLLRLQRIMRENGRRGEISESDSLLSGGGLFGLLRKALRRRTDSFLQSLERWRNPELRLAAARIRRIYADLMQLSEELGCMRPESQTPLEFLAPLGQVFPGLSHELVAITHAYVRVRYGELPETPQELEIVEQAWSRLQVMGEERKRDQKGVALGVGV